jgi:phosphatidylglycerophosphate synthase
MEGLDRCGLRFFYRGVGLYFASFLDKRFKKFNPNILTVLGLIIHLIALLIFVLYGEFGINVYSLVFIFGIQIAFLLDFVDGSYARLKIRWNY